MSMRAEGLMFTADLWQHPSEAGWHFVTLPTELADQVRARAAGAARPFGSVPVTATIGGTSWATSLFTDTALDSYLLPIKADVRRREQINAGDSICVVLDLCREGNVDLRPLGRGA